METVSNRRAPTVVLAGTLALALVVALIVRTSQAAFTADTENVDNTFSAATIDLTDSFSSPMFTLTDLVPGETHEECIEITYVGPTSATSPKVVKLYGAGGGSLADVLDLAVDIYASGQNCDTASPTTTPVVNTTLAAFGAANTDYANGASSSWTPANLDKTRAFRFRVGITSGTGDTEQDGTATHSFTWEIVS
jgi:hypothetical protein